MPSTSLQDFANHEGALRAKYGERTLIVKPQVVMTPRGSFALGGWAFLDGAPAVLPDELDLLVVAWTDARGEMANLPRSPRAVLDVLARYVQRMTAPCEHWTINVPPRDRAELQKRLETLPDHDPLADAKPVTTPARLFPMLKPPTFPYRDAVLHAPLLDRSDAPLVVLAEDTPQGYSFLTRASAGGRDFRSLVASAVPNLSALKIDIMNIGDRVAVSGGADFSADRLLDPQFLAALHRHLGAELWVAVPHRFALYALPSNAGPADIEMFSRVVEHELQRGPANGHAPVSDLVFLVRGTVVVDAARLDEIATLVKGQQSGMPTRWLERGVPHPAGLELVVSAAQEIRGSVTLVGPGAKQLARAMHGGHAGRPLDAATIEHGMLALGDIRGWKPRLFIYALEATHERAVELARASTAAVVVPAASGFDSALTAVAREMCSPILACVGPDAGRDALPRIPDIALAAGPGVHTELLKGLARRVLATTTRPN